MAPWESKEAKDLPCLQPRDAIRDTHRCKWLIGDWTDDTDQLVCVLRPGHWWVSFFQQKIKTQQTWSGFGMLKGESKNHGSEIYNVSWVIMSNDWDFLRSAFLKRKKKHHQIRGIMITCFSEVPCLILFAFRNCVATCRCLLPSSSDGISQLRSPDAKEFAERLMTWHRQGFPELGDLGGCGMGRRLLGLAVGWRELSQLTNVGRCW